MPLSGWQLVGAEQVDVTNPGEIVEIPVNIDRLMQANEKLGICMIHAGTAAGNKTRHFNHAAGLQAPYTNGDLTINYNSFMGAYVPSNTPHFNSYYSLPSSTYGTVWYDAGPTVAPNVTALPLPNAAAGTTGVTTSYKVSGALLTAASTITAPTDVEISFNQSTGFAQTLIISSYPEYQPTDVFARIKNGAAVGAISGNIVHSSPGAPTRNVAVSGNVIAMSLSANSVSAGVTTVGGPGEPATYTLNGSGLTTSTVITAPVGFEVAKSVGGPFAGSVTLTATNYAQPLFVRLTGASVGMQSGIIANASGPANLTVSVSGEVLPPYELKVIRIGPNATSEVDNNAAGFASLLDFRVQSFSAPWTVNSLTFTATGTINADTAVSHLGLYEDNPTAGTQGVYDGPTIDALAGSYSPGFVNSTVTIALNNSAFPNSTNRRFFLRGQLAGTATVSQTMTLDVTAVSATTTSTGGINGVPTAGAVPAIRIAPSHMAVTLNGPLAYTTVLNDSQGPNGNGHVVCDITITPQNDSWNVPSITFSESGSINGRDGLSSLALHLDDGNGVWDGPATDMLATSIAATGFSAPNGFYKAWLTTPMGQFGVNQSKRFFLIAKLAGTATPANTLRVAATEMDQFSPNQGEASGIPTDIVSALVVDLATLSIAAGPANPGDIAQASGAASQVVVGQFRLTASVSAFSVPGLHLTTGGNGDWANNVASVEVYRDNANGVFGANDVLLFSGAASGLGVDCAFSPALDVPQNGSVDLWVVVNTLPSAGANPAETFIASIATPSDVDVVPASAYVAFGTNAPVSGTLRVINFSVASFSPASSGLKGGEMITIDGTGFALPVSLTIGGVPATGTASVNAAGTQITGLIVPEGTGKGLEIVLETNGLDPMTLTQTFSYSTVRSDDSSKPADASGCVGGPAAPLAVLLPGMLGLLALRRRRK
jgi:hypothetical protein